MWAGPLIERKRDGAALAPEEWRALIAAYTAGQVPDYQMSALLMAVFLNGLEPAETAALTGAMLESGARLRFDHLRVPCVDKHSTGGVGDKVSLVLAPLVASCGVAVPMISGRALGHTGGTLDKLEAIPGFRTALTPAETQRQVELLGCAMIGQSADIAPADRKLYALRDVTSTVESIPLIAASILSKKLAEGISGLVLDIKRGSGAFLPDLEDGLELARTMIRLGEDHGCRTVALLTAMDRPLGNACGVALETEEAIAALRGEAPEDLLAVTYALGGEMLLLGGVAADAARARAMLVEAITSGKAADKFRSVVAAQGGNPAVLDDPGLLPQAREVTTFQAARAGYVASVEPRMLGKAIVEMGGGRRRMEDPIDASVGFVIAVRPGDAVEAGQPLASIYAGDAEGLSTGTAALKRAIRLAPGAPAPPLPLLSHRVTAAGVETLP
ncbi:MAG: thymidine phosphorylase [Gemmatimonadetes bacterium RBG_16_66_8]|nr:MAG: thymidine phosphorylase [Gemmatimonadetes bacterium RBG_16_66_8]